MSSSKTAFATFRSCQRTHLSGACGRKEESIQACTSTSGSSCSLSVEYHSFDDVLSVHGQFRFSSLAMPPPSDAASTGGRLSGGDISRYMEEFYKKCLLQQDQDDDPRQNIVRFNTEVIRIRRGPNEQGWSILVKDTISTKTETLRFPRIVLCTGVSVVLCLSEHFSFTNRSDSSPKYLHCHLLSLQTLLGFPLGACYAR